MKKLLAKSLSALLVFLILMSSALYAPVMVSATQIDSTEDNILKIYDLNDLIAINEDLNGNYILMNDIDLSSIDSWTPIGEGIEYWADKTATGFTENNGSYFTGSFDGNGHSINNLTITETPEPTDSYDKNTNSYGLFAHISGATIKNVTLDNVNINIDAVKSNGENYTRKTIVGAFCASMSNSIITYCNFSGNIKVNNCTMSGSLSSMDLGNSNISYVKNSIDGDLKGGIIGSCDNGGTVVSFCENKGNIKGSGGIVAGGTLNINNCVNYGNIFGMSNIGGIVGRLAYETSSISNCINIGEIKSESDNCALGGIVGYCSGNNNYEVIITNCENQGKIQFISHDKNGGYISAVGGIIGNFDNTTANIGEVSNCQNKGSIIIDYGDCIDGKSVNCGGIIGFVVSIEAMNLYNYGDIEFINSGNSCPNISGIIGSSFGYPNNDSASLVDSVNYGNISIEGATYDSTIGVGVISVSGVLQDCYSKDNVERIGNEGNITISGNPRNIICGGVVNRCHDNSSILDAYNSGNIIINDSNVDSKDTIRIGGIVSIIISSDSCTLKKIHNYGTISITRPSLTDSDNIGLIYALNLKSAVITTSNLYIYKSNESVRYGAGDSDIVGSITSLNSFSNKNSFDGFDFDNTWELTNDRYPTLKNVSNNTAKSIEDCDILLNNNAFTYDGTAKEPSVTVKDGTKTLTSGTDYTVSYSNNTNVGTATVTITGKGNYSGTVTKTFTISAKSISSTTVTLGTTSYTYDGTAKKPSVTVKDGTKTLTSGADYTVTYSNNTNAGTATVTITGKGNYKGTASKTFTINAKSISSTTVTLGATSYTYDGTAKKPSVTAKDGSTTLTNGTDYTVTYYNNTNVGTATVTVTGKGNYTGTASKTFTINAKSISSTTVTLGTTSYTYDGTAKKPSVTVKDGTKTLTSGTDYTVSYSNNTNAGTATVTVAGKGNYTGTVSKNFTITNSKQEFTWGQDNWNFNNSSDYFANYNVNSTVMNMMKDDFKLSNSDIYELQNNIKWDNYYGFMGSCFGMTISEILAKQGDLKLSRYGLNDVVYKNSNTSNATSVINFIQELQSNSNFCQSIRQAPFLSGNHTQYEFVEKLESVLKNENKLVKISYGIKQLNRNTGEYSSSGYHAVLGYGVEDCEYYSSVTGKTYDKRVLIADPNYSAKTSLYNDACLYYRSSDHSWIVPYWNKKYSSVTQLCYWNAGTSTSTNTGNIRNIMKYNSLTDTVDLMADYQVSHYVAGLEIDNFSKNTTNVDQVMNSGNPNLDYAGDSGSGIARYDVEMDDSYNVNENNEFYALWNPTANYELSYTKPSDYNLKMDYDNITYYADLTNSFYTLFKPSGAISVKGSNAKYDITMVTDDADCVTDWYAVRVLGNYMDDLVFTEVKGGYTLESSNLNNVTINAKNNNSDVSRTFSTQYNSVFIYEIDENTIGLKVDTDNNGTYETELKTTMIGDVNGDGSISIEDATELQKHLANTVDFKDELLAVADTNGDGSVSIADATQIQKYLAQLIPSLG